MMSIAKEKTKWKNYWQDEVDAHLLYKTLANLTDEKRQKDIYSKLSDIEEEHIRVWEKMMRDNNVKVGKRIMTAKAKILNFVAKNINKSFVENWMQKEEGNEVLSYLDLYKGTKDKRTRDIALKLATDSKHHAEQLAEDYDTDSEQWHKTSSGGLLRNIVYGFNDGLTANFGLIAGIIGADVAPHLIIVTGVAGLFADALSMGASGYLAAKSEQEVYEKERQMEADEIRIMPELEKKELELIYQAKGLDETKAREMTEEIFKDPVKTLNEKVKEELGISAEVIKPFREAWLTGLATAFGALIPVLPFFFMTGPAAIWTAFAIAMLSHFGVGAARSFFTGRGIFKSGFDMFLVGFGVAVVGYFIGEWLAKIL